MKIKLLVICGLLLFSACSDDYSPKPIGYFRISLEDKGYELFKSDCSFQFMRPKSAKINEGTQNCWYNLKYPNHNATLHLTYKQLNSNLPQLIDESYKLAYDHSIKSDGISEKVYMNENTRVYGVMYDIHGNSASNLQFFATDSVNHFLRGSLYFNCIPNADSLQPVKDYIKRDLQTMMESLIWLN